MYLLSSEHATDAMLLVRSVLTDFNLTAFTVAGREKSSLPRCQSSSFSMTAAQSRMKA